MHLACLLGNRIEFATFAATQNANANAGSNSNQVYSCAKPDLEPEVGKYFETHELSKVLQCLKELTPDSLKAGSLPTFMVNQVTVAWISCASEMS